MDDARVSIICCFRDEERFLGDAIESVLGQDCDGWELLLVDDGSRDASTAIAQEAARRDRRITYLSPPGRRNIGRSAARNLALVRATGEFLAFIDGDDVWRPGKLSEQQAILDAHPEVGMVCGGVNYWASWEGGMDRIVVPGHVHDRPVQPPEALLSVYPLGAAHAASLDALIRRRLVEDVGGFEEAFAASYGDQVLFSKIYLASPVIFSSRVWLDYRQHAASCTSTAHSTGTYAGTRRTFLGWLAEYSQRLSPDRQAAVSKSIARAEWELDHPLYGRVARRVRSARIAARSCLPSQ